MFTRDFHFDLPEELIAQEPISPRDHSRLLHVKRKNGTCEHRHFYELEHLLKEGDVLVLNDTRVISARLRTQVKGRDAKSEILLLREVQSGTFECMVRPGKHFQVGMQVSFSEAPELSAEVIAVNPEDGARLLRFNLQGDKLRAQIESAGEAPLPPYIRNSKAQKTQYQTVYARHGESAAAPTAGLHFTEQLLQRLDAKGISLEFITLNVGRGTFLPVKAERITDHKMHSERYTLTSATADRLNQARAAGKRIIAVGTTSVRVLESCAAETGTLLPGHGETSIFIYPGYPWKVVKALITNFHLPESTLIMLVSSFAGKALTETAYATAIAERYRFYSFGDAMFIE